MKKIFTKAPMMFIITAAIFGGAVTYSFQSYFEHYGDPELWMHDPLWFYVFMVGWNASKIAIPLIIIVGLAYYLLKFIIVKTYNRFAKR